MSSPSRPATNRWLRQRILAALVIFAILAAAAWLSLIILTRIDALFLPGQELNVGGLSVLPGVEEAPPDDLVIDEIERRINILVMGLDRRPEEGDIPTRTDSMFVVTIDPITKTAAIIGMPRDLYVEIPYRSGNGYYKDRINTAWVAGEAYGYSGGGPGLVRQVLERNFGITIDHHVIVDFEGFIELIDALDGIDLYVPERVSDPNYLAKERPDGSTVTFEAGQQHMNGQRALEYARIRYGSDDLERIQRQQRVIFAAIARTKELNLTDVRKMLSLARKYKDTIETDVNDFQLPGFASLAAKISPDKITAVSIGAATRPWTTPAGHEVLLFDKSLVKEIVQALFIDPRVVEDNALVEVQNGAGAAGLATSVARYLADFGFPASALTVANAVDGEIRPLTEIIDYSGKAYSVERLASLLTVPPERVRRAGPNDAAARTTEADVLVILGTDATTQLPAANTGG